MTDLHKPAEIAVMVEQAGVTKANTALPAIAMLAILAGAFIALGGAFYTMVMTGVDPGYGPVRMVGGIAFSLGLILVIIGGAELFTGNALIVMAWVDKLVSTTALLRNWIVVYFGNLAGSLLIAALVAATGLLSGPFGETAAKIASGKFALGPVELLSRAILCNALVCLAVWLSFAARTVVGKAVAIVFPVSAFVALGFEHSIANMYLLPIGLAAGAQGTIAEVVSNLVVVTIGNIIGGAGGVALAYRFALKPQI